MSFASGWSGSTPNRRLAAGHPRPPKWQLVRDGILMAAILLTIWFGFFSYFRPPFDFPEYLRGHGDRYLHIAAFGSVTLFAIFGRRKIMLPLFMLVLAAIALETVQIWKPGRSANLLDLYASFGGVALGGLLAFAANIVLIRPRH